MLALPALALAHLERPSYWPDPTPDCSVSPCAGGNVPEARSLESAVDGAGPGDVLVVCQGKKGKESLASLHDSLSRPARTAIASVPASRRSSSPITRRRPLLAINPAGASSASTTRSSRPCSMPATTTASSSCPASTPNRTRAALPRTTRPASPACSRRTPAATRRRATGTRSRVPTTRT